tara:strand:- start:1660 stop:1878 length:219 start_codon:yes stop_codon:yes gene_type:complete
VDLDEEEDKQGSNMGGKWVVVLILVLKTKPLRVDEDAKYVSHINYHSFNHYFTNEEVSYKLKDISESVNKFD